MPTTLNIAPRSVRIDKVIMEAISQFTTLIPTARGTFAEQLQSLKVELRRWLTDHALTQGNLVMSRVYLTDAANQWETVKTHSLYTCYLAVAACSYVEQPLLAGCKVALQIWCVNQPATTKTQLTDGVLVECGGTKLIFHTVRFKADEVRGLDAREQTHLAFARHIRLLAEHRMNLKDNCHRTWIYVRDIDRNYAGVVTGRNEVFDDYGLTVHTHFIASTGIGGYTDNAEVIVAMDFLSIDTADDAHVSYLSAPDYLNPTAEYGVAFERGTALTLWGERYRFISGTASIDCHGECLHRGDVKAQTERLFLNISQLLAADAATLADVRYFIVYLRDVADAAWVDSYMQEHFPTTPYLITEARVCRPEWLIEVECIAASC